MAHVGEKGGFCAGQVFGCLLLLFGQLDGVPLAQARAPGTQAEHDQHQGHGGIGDIGNRRQPGRSGDADRETHFLRCGHAIGIARANPQGVFTCRQLREHALSTLGRGYPILVESFELEAIAVAARIEKRQHARLHIELAIIVLEADRGQRIEFKNLVVTTHRDCRQLERRCWRIQPDCRRIKRHDARACARIDGAIRRPRKGVDEFRAWQAIAFAELAHGLGFTIHAPETTLAGHPHARIRRHQQPKHLHGRPSTGLVKTLLQLHASAIPAVFLQRTKAMQPE